MKIKLLLIAFLFILLASIDVMPIQAESSHVPLMDATPTVDIFAEPPLPEDPTQLELGAHIYWHHCMPCHGDVGQGLTDEFRYQWEPDHQNCWDAGCHSGKYKNDSFPIPTIIPPLAGAGLTTQHDPGSLFKYLKTTHPPQDPGLLTDEEYQALVAFLYKLNNAPIPAPVDIPTPSPAAAPTISQSPSPRPSSAIGKSSISIPASSIMLAGGLLLLAGILISYLIRKKP